MRNERWADRLWVKLAMVLAMATVLAATGCSPSSEQLNFAQSSDSATGGSPPPTATATETATPQNVSHPHPTSTPTPTATPAPTPRPLTEGGCCPEPFWSPDSRLVMFIDKPDEDAPVGIWGVDITEDDSAPQLITERIAFYTPDLAFRMELGESSTTIERLSPPLHLANSDPEVTRWTIPAGGRSVSISPGQTRIAWAVVDENLPFEERISRVWVADLDGENARQIATVARGGIYGWVSDEVLLMSGRESLDSNQQLYYTLSLADASTVELARGERIRGAILSPDGAWMAYFVALEEDLSQNGLWLARTDGTERRRLDRELFGAYRWRDNARLLIVPIQPDAASHQLLQYDIETGDVGNLTDPKRVPFKIANGQWSVSPDGRHVVFVEAGDHNLWLLTLPE